jgi:hypothetical protein
MKTEQNHTKENNDFRKCLCRTQLCGKCLSGCCKDKNCVIHPKRLKIIWRKNWELNNKRPFPGPENF